MRQPLPAERLSAQRASAETRQLEAEKAELARQLEVREDELAQAQLCRQTAERRQRELEKELRELQPPSLDGCKSAVPKLKPKSDAFYQHVAFGARWLARFDVADVPALLASVLGKVGRDKDVDLRKAVLQGDPHLQGDK